jgi:hypothetical protein
MTQEEYLVIRNKKEIPFEVWFEYYRERGGTIEDFKKFEEVFTILLFNAAEVQSSNGQMREVTLKSALENFYAYYNQKFGL